MANKKPKKKAIRSKRSGIKKAELIKGNSLFLEKLKEFLKLK